MIVLIPAYEPDHRLLSLIEELSDLVIVVDDGSGPAYAPVFEEARRLGAIVLTHEVNRGKGAALKTGFRLCAGHDVVCADSDGQHTPSDIARVAARVRATGRMVLGARRFDGKVPLRSRFGNVATRICFATATGRLVTDTQTGLRGYPAGLLGWLSEVPGERFEYEINVLLRAVRCGLPIEETTIATIYLNGNASSHFRPMVDSLRIYAPILRFAASSLAAFAVDVLALLILYSLTNALLPSVLIARAISSTVNFLVNRRLVFGARGSLRSSAIRYWSLVGGLAVANYLVLAGLTGAGIPLLPAKILTESTLFAASYLGQRALVFGAPVNGGQTGSGDKTSTPHSPVTAGAQASPAE